MAEADKGPIARRPMPGWYAELSSFSGRSWARGIGQIINTVIPYFVIIATMIFSVVRGWPYWMTLLMAIPATLFLVRAFIIFHDCTHGSFFPSNRANRIVGFVTGALAFTAFEPWRLSHLKHHATTGQLDHRGVGDVRTMTLEEYADAPRLRRFLYRLYRNPVILFLFGSFYTFLVVYRFKGLGGTPAERRSVILTDLLIAAIAVSASLGFGFRAYATVQLPVIFLAGVSGIWLFYVQHQFDPGYWARDKEWNRLDAAMNGSSYYKLPAVLRWFTGSIGIHHVHHLQPRIPNYRLHKAYLAVPQAQSSRPLTIRQSIRSVRMNLWSEVQERFLSFRQAARIIRGESQSRA